MGELPQQLLIQVILILLNAFFAATEIAVISLNTAKLKKQQEAGDKMAGKLLKMAEEPSDFLSTIQIGITLAGFLGSAFAADNFSDGLTKLICEDLGVTMVPERAVATASLVIITIILSYFTLIFGELVPKRIAMQKSYEVAKIACGVVTAVAFVMRPVIAFLAFSTNLVLKCLHMKVEAEEEQVTEDEIRLMIDLGKENGAIDEEENEWLQNMFEFGDTTVEEAMTREFDVVSVSVTDSEEDIIGKIQETGLSRFPVYDEEGEDILGILYAREYLLNLRAKNRKGIRDLLHPPYFVPESIHTDRLFRDMQKKKLHMAVVVDEYGNISGIITLEDLLEEIVGNIYDEFDKQEEPEAEQLGEDKWRIPGDTPVEEIGEALGMELPESEDYDSIGGLILNYLGSVPKDGTTVDVEVMGLALHAERIKGRRIESVIVEKLPDTGADPDGGTKEKSKKENAKKEGGDK